VKKFQAQEKGIPPPPPPPLPVLAPATLYALLLLVAGVLLVFRPGTVGLSADAGLVLGVAAVIGGVFVLVSRMRERSVDDGDDGAVV
jgi:drug/metabolite transporter (DMT)-like permease